MNGLSHSEIITLLLALGVLLGTARLLGEVARKLRQPAVIGELFAGILLGPTILGAVWPSAQGSLFPSEGPLPVSLHALTTVAIMLFLLVAGMEVDLSTIWRRRRAAMSVGVGGMVVPFVMAFPLAWLLPVTMDAGVQASELTFPLFFATAMAISALPVVAKILIDLQMFKSDIGMTIIAAAVFNDIVGWLVFALILALMGRAGEGGPELWQTVTMTLVFAGVMLTLGRAAVDRALPWLHAHASVPGSVLGFAATGAALCAAFTEWLGVHAIFGAFIFGIALGDSRHLRQSTRETIDQFVSFIFAPLFFASIGLRVDFLDNFDLVLVLIVLVVATVGKVGGCVLFSRFTGFQKREAWAVAFGLNARGAMEIILGLLALEAGLIGERMFVALVVMALVTSMTSGSLMQRAIGRVKPVRFWEFAGPRQFVQTMSATDRDEAIAELAAVASGVSKTPLDAEVIAAAARARERLVSSGVGLGVAVPHARIAGLAQPIVVIGRARRGIDFDARDGQPARLIILLVTPLENAELQLRLLASVAHVCEDEAAVERLLSAANWTELLAVLNEVG
ncbi:MAG: cation:proton antiporter [Phycisphaeraceae bacterium]|nr:cation:proton antiporter [Phycisphaeraceae bacterium]MBX3368499.1 cation:proton antiporter [Phycisphaeraceae bacterium]